MKQLPEGITRPHLLTALDSLEQNGTPSAFGMSSTYDVWHEGRRYPPKPVLALAAAAVSGTEWGPGDFSGGEGPGRPNDILRTAGFVVVDKDGWEVLGPRIRGKRVAGSANARADKRFWIEKTLVKGRPDREEGPHRLGVALWSPTTSKNGSDIYASMRKVEPGDAILHLTDNTHISAVSLVAGATSTDFEGEPYLGIAGTDWVGPCYRTALRNTVRLEPPLHRDWMLTEEVLGRFRGRKHVFFSKGLQLNQGAYLTEAQSDMMSALNAAYLQKTGRVLPYAEAAHVDDLTELVDLARVHVQFADALASANLRFGPGHTEFVRAFLASLATKRFVILTGLSGSGKTQIARMFGHWIGKERYRCIPVRPDWTGPEALLGYESALEAPVLERLPWHVPPALEFMLDAAAHPDVPYLLLLDEMNLAHVERYFADVLSGMETGDGCLPNLRQVGPKWIPAGGDTRMPLPSNLFIVGTVNVDETTYMFSPKVLDRANTIEFRVTKEDLPEDPTELRVLKNCQPGAPDTVKAFLRAATEANYHETRLPVWITEFAARLRETHELLAPGGFEFGHRVFFEAIRFSAIHAEMGGETLEEALDLQIMQKVLPRIHGARRRIETTLRCLGSLAWHGETRSDASEFDPLGTGNDGSPALPKTFDKVQRMTRRVREQQFASFAE